MAIRNELPELILIADGFTDPARQAAIRTAVAAGVAWVQLRDHDAEEERFVEAVEQLLRKLRDVRPDVRISVNTRLDVATRFGLDGHIGMRGPDPRAARLMIGAGTLGVSAHDLDEATAAAAAGADYCMLSPIYPTASKPGRPGQGLFTLRSVCERLPELPVYALGGITPARVADCLEAGAHGVGVLSGILEAPDPAEATWAYLAAM